MGRKSNTDLRRREIIEAMRVEMSAVGYERASTKSIATRAGLAPGLVHYHFNNKQEILLALVEGLIEDAERRFDAILSAPATAIDKLIAFVTSRVGLGPASDTNQVKAWVSIIAEAIGQTKVRNRVSKWLADDLERLAGLFRAAGSDRPKEQAAALLSLILGSFSLHAIGVAGVPRGYAERELTQWLRTALEKSSRGSYGKPARG